MLTSIGTGRTGRIGHRGLAFSFSIPEKDEPFASLLTRTLLETKQSVPDFLKPYIPAGWDKDKVEFNDSDFEEDVAVGGYADDAGNCDNGNGAGDGWGGQADGIAAEQVADAPDGW